MSRRSLAGLLLVACLVALLVARKTTHPDPARQGPDDREAPTVDALSADPSSDAVREASTSPSAFASFKIDGMV